MESTTAERLVANEYRFREVNQRLESDVRDIADPGEQIAFVCECSATTCREAIALTLERYAELRAADGRFAVVPGHEIPAIERVVGHGDGHLIVEKLAV